MITSRSWHSILIQHFCSIYVVKKCYKKPSHSSKVPQSANIPGLKRYQFEPENINQFNLSNSAVSSSDDLRVRNSSSSLCHNFLSHKVYKHQKQQIFQNIGSRSFPLSQNFGSQYIVRVRLNIIFNINYILHIITY